METHTHEDKDIFRYHPRGYWSFFCRQYPESDVEGPHATLHKQMTDARYFPSTIYSKVLWPTDTPGMFWVAVVSPEWEGRLPNDDDLAGFNTLVYCKGCDLVATEHAHGAVGI